jgi:acyl-coenzyme A synthetase/AMP-(fatty) acid ligase
MAHTEAQSLRQRLGSGSSEPWFWDRAASAPVTDLCRGTSLGGRLGDLADRSVLIATASQLTTALTLIELDGVARRVLVLPPDADPAHLAALIADAEIDAIVVDRDTPARTAFELPVQVLCTPEIVATERLPAARRATEWVLLTSGTAGVPKMVAHSLGALTAAIKAGTSDEPVVWATFYDIRRYGGLQIFLRAVLGGASLVLSSAGEPIAEHLDRLGRRGVTHLSGTPSHWRRALMSPAIGKISPRYVRLSGEIADQAVLDSLRHTFPNASIGHAYASTEAGVAFEVSDGLAGFPVSFVAEVRDGVELKVADGSLRIRSPRAASGYVGSDTPLADPDGFIDTGDMLESCGDRYIFTGRRGGIINIGGLKVHPEEIEAVINRHPQVRMSLVRPKRSPVTGSIVVADVVLKSDRDITGGEAGEVKGDILKLCREALSRHKVPAAISFVAALEVAASGKLARRHG